MGGSHIITLFSAIIGCLIFPKLGWFWLAFVFLIPVFIDFQRQHSFKGAFIKGMGFGLITMGFFHRWMFELTEWSAWYWVVLLWLAYSLYLSLFYGLTFGLYAKFTVEKRHVPNELKAFILPACWVLGEWLRSLGPLGNTAGSLGFSLTSSHHLLQFGSIVGLFGLSFLVVFINGFIFSFFTSRQKGRWGIAFLIFMLVVLGWGRYRLNHTPAIGNTYKVAVVQGNHEQSKKLDPKQWNKIRSDYLSLTEKALTDEFNPDFVFWPETFIPVLNLKDTTFVESVSKLASANAAAIFLGTPISENNKFYNAIALATEDGISSQSYRKLKLMPFGEYLPFRSLVEKADIGLLKGEDYSSAAHQELFKVKDIKLGAGICLESIYPNFFKRATAKGAELLVVLVNNAWFFDSAAARQHLQMSRLRAVENNRFLVQAANTGISAIIDNKGRIVKESRLNEQAILTSRIDYRLSRTIYSRLGNIVVLISGFFLLVGLVLFPVRGR